MKEAQGSQYLREVEKGKYSQTDVYIGHENIVAADRKSVLLLSNKRVLFIAYNQMLGNWGIDWEFTLPEITGPPAVENDSSASDVWYLYIKPKEEILSSKDGKFHFYKEIKTYQTKRRNSKQ